MGAKRCPDHIRAFPGEEDAGIADLASLRQQLE
jgi:hypothetical protein